MVVDEPVETDESFSLDSGNQTGTKRPTTSFIERLKSPIGISCLVGGFVCLLVVAALVFRNLGDLEIEPRMDSAKTGRGDESLPHPQKGPPKDSAQTRRGNGAPQQPQTISKSTLTLEGHTWQVMSVAFSPDGKRVVSGSLDRISHDLRRARLVKNQPAEIAMFQISEVQEAPAFNGGRSFLALRGHTQTDRPWSSCVFWVNVRWCCVRETFSQVQSTKRFAPRWLVHSFGTHLMVSGLYGQVLTRRDQCRTSVNQKP